MSLIFDVAQDAGFSLIKRNKKVRSAVRLKVQVLGVPDQNSPYFEKFRYTMNLLGVKIKGRDVQRPPQSVKKPRLWGILGTKDVKVESNFYDKVWDIPSKEEILARLA